MTELSEQALSNERVVDVRKITPSVRHTILAQLVAHLAAGQTLQLIVDHDPRRLKRELGAGDDGGASWDYLEQGPDVWRVRIGQRACA